MVASVEPDPRSVLSAAPAASRRGRLPAVFEVWLIGALVSQLGGAQGAFGWRRRMVFAIPQAGASSDSSSRSASGLRSRS
jgi:hypothetical protein